MKKLLFASACLLVATPHLAHAQSRYSISVKNDSDNAIWVTTYTAPTHRKGIIKAQCVPGGTKATVPSQSNDVGGWTLFEIKKDKTSCAVHDNISVVEKNVKSYIVFHIAGNRIVNSGQ